MGNKDSLIVILGDKAINLNNIVFIQWCEDGARLDTSQTAYVLSKEDAEKLRQHLEHGGVNLNIISELLEMCEDLIFHMTHSRDCKHGFGFTYDFCPVPKARAAIAKAKIAMAEAKGDE